MLNMTRKQAISYGIVWLLLTIIPAAIHGHYSRRWQSPADMQTAAERLAAFPQQFGEWKQEGEEEPLPETVLNELHSKGYINRRYLNQRLGREVTVMLMLGPAGPLIRHPPEICYGSRANTLLRDPRNVNVKTPDGAISTFQVLQYKNTSAVAGEFLVCFGWNDGNGWVVPKLPRVELGGAPKLYKLQVLSTEPGAGKDDIPTSTKRFLDDFLPLLNKTVINP